MSLPTIGTLWIGPELGWMEQLCLQSILDHGHEVVLYTYDKVGNVPKGVRIADANDILPSDNIIRHANTGSPAYHADIFRLHMLQQTDYIWADTDAFCCQPWDIKRGKHFHGWISDKKPIVNNGVLRLPKTSKTLKNMLKFTSDEYPIPPWYSAEKQQKLQELKEGGNGVHVSLLPWGVWGPDALTWFLKATGEIEHSRPGHVIYPVPFSIAGVMLNPNRFNKAKNLIRDDTLSIHFWGRRFRNIAAKYDGIPHKDSYVAMLCKRHNINPKETAHMMQNPKIIDPIETVDFSMFDDVDVANLILQRSEVGDVGQEIRDWLNGNDAPLQKYAQENRNDVLAQALEVARRECEFFVEAIDDQNPESIADIGCGYAFADLFLYHRYNADITLIDIEESKDRHFGFEKSGSGYASLDKAFKFLTSNGVPKEKIRLVNPKKENVADIGCFDLAISLASCGFHYPVTTYSDFFSQQISKDGAIVLDIRKGSGGIGLMKEFGEVEVLAKHQKYSTVVAKKGGFE
ncbi:MAG TPA: class I SAM-dependent methyltransferase [Rhodobacteraceae bacterium]|nr:class I SAM-dependent methyltransferase [Paracoccaceae bacterium]